MNLNEVAAEEELNESFIKANPDWKTRLQKETRYIHYDYESNIIHLKFGSPGFTIMHWLHTDDDEFQWIVEDETLHIVGVEIMPFRQYYAPRYPKLQAAYDALCRDWGAGDWMINLLPKSETRGDSSAAAFADVLLECARDPVPIAE
jgi:hypothetical protein